MNKQPSIGSGLAVACALALTACGTAGGPGSDGSTSTPVTTTAACAAPLAAEAISTGLSITDNIPSDYDSTATPTPTPTTTINFTMMLPARCPGDQFPLILQSHGYGGSRLTAIAANGTLDPTVDHFDSIDNLVMALPYYGYVVISYDERGHGTSLPGMAAHNARIIDPAAETQDAIALLDWAYYHSGATPDPNDPAHPSATGYVQSFVQREDSSTGIAKDIRVGTIGYSYGGGFEMPLALMDSRVDTIVPNGTWNNLLYSLLPGDSVKLGFDSLLCLLALTGNVNNTPLVGALCNLIGPQGATAATLRTRADLATAATTMGIPRDARDSDELLNIFYTHGTRYFEVANRDGKAINPLDNPGYVSPALTTITGTPSSPGLNIGGSGLHRPIPALFLQGNRDSLFNLVDADFNYNFFKQSGGDVRLLTTEGGHMNPLAGQTEGTANCGGVVGLNTILAWFDQKLKGINSTTYSATPKVCISVTVTPTPSPLPTYATSTVGEPTNDTLIALLLQDVPVGSQSGTGGIPTTAATLTATVATTDISTPIFVPVGSPITVANAVLAGVPRIQSINITAGTGSLVTPIAYVGVGLQHSGGTPYLVDEQVTPFAALAPDTGTAPPPCPTALSLPATAHCSNRGTGNDSILLPGVGEVLQVGDQLGLLFYQNQVQYLPANTAGKVGISNPYTATLTNVELPVLVPGSFPNSRLSCGAPTANANCPQ